MDLPISTSALPFIDHFIEVNNIHLHYIEYPSDGPTILMMHGLTANAHAFDGLIAKGLNKHYRIISPDLRGRGQSDHPAFAYSMEDHAADILGLIEHLKLERVILAGHSFGGLLSYYLAASNPALAERVIILDAAARMNPNAAEMLSFSLGRFTLSYPSMAAYLAEIKKAPYIDPWDNDMLSYYEADVKHNPDGSVRPRSNLTDIIEISMGVGNISWPSIVENVVQPCILLNGLGDYSMGEPLLPDDRAQESVDLMKHAHYIPIEGNHHTMLYGDFAVTVVAAIRDFVPLA